MRLSSSLLACATAALAAAPLIAIGGSHNTLTWDALNDNGVQRLDSKYTERWGRETTQQELEVKLDDVAPGTPVQVQLNGVDLFPMLSDEGGQCGAEYHFRSRRADGVRPDENRRIDKGDVIRVYNLDAGVDISAVYHANGEP